MKRTIWALPVLLAVVTAGDSFDAEYRKRAAGLATDDADGHYRLALWCGDKGLAAHAKREHRAVVTLDPEHRASRRALGYEQVRKRWVSGKEAMRAKGFIEHEGAWVTPEEYRLFARDDIAAREARAARKTGNAALKLAWNRDPAVRARAMSIIEGMDEQHRLRPFSIAARINRPDVRMRAVKGLGGLKSKASLPALYKRAVFDTDAAIRRAAVDAIKEIDAKGKIGPFVRALNSPFDPVRTNAVKALGALGDADAIGPLVARYQVVGGSGQSVYISSVNQISYVQDFDVEVAQTAFIADPVIGVIQDGLVLNFRALSTNGYIDIYERPALAEALSNLTGKDLGDNPKAWSKWYRTKRRAARSQNRNDG